ncbi:MAG TPA: hypothetical protein VEX68_24290, partial [Bryobacteraceae bacterium]|nr:hypothetical protein [Bryobacteraceae bacterium]
MLAFGLTFEDLYSRDGLVRLDSIFIDHLGQADPALCERLLAARGNPESLERKQHSELIIEVSPYVDDFVGELFKITNELRALQQRHSVLAPLFALKRKFIQKRAASGMTVEKATAMDGRKIAARLETVLGEPLTEHTYFEHVSRWLEDETAHAEQLQLASQYAAWAAISPAGREKHRHDVLFKLPQKLDQVHLIHVDTVHIEGTDAFRLHPSHWRNREGFDLTDPGADLAGAID